MDKETLSNYGWIVICTLVLAVMIALASPFGKFVSDAVKSTTQGLYDVNHEALIGAGIDIKGQSFNEEEYGADGDFGDIDGNLTSQYIRGKVGTTGYVDEGRKYVYGVKECHNPLSYFELINATNYIEMSQGTAQSGVTNGTGSVLTVYSDSSKSEVLDTYTLIIFGDVDGDGIITVNDYTDLQLYNLGRYPNITDDRLFSADVIADGVLDKYDEHKILLHAAAQKLIPNNVWTSTELVANVYTDAAIDYQAKWIYGVPERSDLLEYLRATKDGYIEITNNNSKFTGTGSKITLYTNSSKNEIIDEYTLIVFGDVDGNGMINGNDAIALKDYVNNSTEVSDEVFNASDIDCDGELTLADADLIIDHVTGTKFPVNLWK
jgi:hypothetical protein